VTRTAVFAAIVLLLLPAAPARAFDPALLESVVSVLPLWPGHARGGDPGSPPGVAPEGTAVAIAAGGYLVTALHVVDRSTEITVRLNDGRLRPAQLVGLDGPTDIAVLRIDEELPVLPPGPEPALGAPVCAIGNQFGLDLSVACGVVSATRRTNVGFNPIEDFIQTDATVNPGASGGALVDAEGRLVGMLSAIFTKDSDASIGVNFAASMTLVERVTEDIIAQGRVRRVTPGFRIDELTWEERATLSGTRISGIQPEGPAATAGLQVGDLMQEIAGRRIHQASDVTTAVQLQKLGATFPVVVERAGEKLTLSLTLPK